MKRDIYTQLQLWEERYIDSCERHRLCRSVFLERKYTAEIEALEKITAAILDYKSALELVLEKDWKWHLRVDTH